METLTGNAGGYNIVEISNDYWMFQVADGEMKFGSFKEIILFAILRYDFSIGELETAIHTMVEENHNAAHFGMWQTFIYSFNYEFSNERRAS